ncbi:unnamed protein product [Ectocarpus sp. CCAP 1310/34]|nr:unnamed protein product [Ectocarpus sp. CCAP 1310/34]
MAEAMLRRYWGAGVEFVAKDLDTEGSKLGEGSNYRRAHHHITAFWSAFMTLPVEGDEVVDGVIRWIEARARAHKTFAVWKHFLLHDYPAYIAFLNCPAHGQEVANRLYKTLTKRIVSSTMEELAPIAQLREVAMLDFESHFVEKPRTERDRCRELSVKRAPAVRAAIDCLRESPAFKGDDGKDKKDLMGATKKNIFSIPARNSTNKATKSQGRSSALKDTVGNAHAGGKEWKAWALNMLDVAREGGGAATPYSMANATGGPLKWVREHCAYGFAVDPVYDADAHGVDLPVSIHQGLLSKWFKSMELLVVCYDRQELEPAIKGHEQLGRTEKLGECSRTFDPKSTDPVPSLQYGYHGVAFETVSLLRFRDGTDPIPDVERHRGPDIGEAELPVVSSLDTDLWMIILLAMTTGWLPPRGEGAVDVTVQRVVGGETKFLWMNRVFAGICELQDGSESAWPPVNFRSWVPTDADKSVRTEGLFDEPLFFEEQDGTWAVDVDECAKLLATMFFYKDEAAFGTAHSRPASLLESVDGDVEDDVSLVRYAILQLPLQLPKEKTTATCPSSVALRKQAERGNAIFRYWQNGLRETLPTTEFAGKGWGVDPRGKGSDSDELTAEKSRGEVCVHAMVGASQTGPIEGVARPQPLIDTRPQPSLRLANAMAPLIASMEQKDSHGAEQSDVEAATPESPASNDVSSGEAAVSKNADLQDPESDENSDGSVGALDDLIKLASGESGSSDGESDGLSERSIDPAWSDGDTDDGAADLVTDAWN